ncbi:MAG: hypothetical protein U0R19_20815 [Bryobacteraceae bacterium]
MFRGGRARQRGAALLILLACGAAAQDPGGYRVETIAGSLPNQDGVLAAEALLYRPQGIAAAGDGTVYISDPFLGIRALEADGVVRTVKPSIPPTPAIAADGAGYLYSVSGPEIYIRTPAGERQTFRPFSGLPMPLPASFVSVAVGPDGTAVVADSGNRVVARVQKEGIAQPIAGLGSRVTLNGIPNRVAVDAKGNTYIATRSQVFRLSGEELLLVAGSGEFGKSVVGTAAVGSPFGQLGAIACGREGEIYVVDGSARSVFVINAAGVIEGAVWEGNAVDIAVDSGGKLLVLDGAGLVVRVEKDGAKQVAAGRLPFGGDGGPATEAQLNFPSAVAADDNGGLWIADTGNNRIRQVAAAGTMGTVAGGEREITGPTVLAADGEGGVYFASRGFGRVSRLRADGSVEIVAGSGSAGDAGDEGPAVDASFQSIDGLAVDKSGILYISDRVSNRVRVVGNGTVFGYAGTGLRGVAGDGPARSTPLAGPTLLAIDGAGDLIVVESAALRLRKVQAASGAMTSVSPTNPVGTPGDANAAILCASNTVSGMAADAEGNLFVAGNSRVCRFDREGKSWGIAGSRVAGFGGDGGPASDALFGTEIGLAIDSTGSVLVADPNNQRIRKLTR